MSLALTYTALSARSTFRNTRFLVLTVALPLILYLVFNSLYGRDGSPSGNLTTGAYLMVSMAAYGGLGATISAGSRIAVERQTGWNRQLRLSALSPAGYVISKAAVAMLVALPAILLVFLAGRLAGHVSLPVGTWLAAGFAVWIALIPFAVIGLVLGFAGTVDSIQPLTMLVYIGLSILGGLWFPVDALSPFLQSMAKLVPSYWVAGVGRDVLSGSAIGLQGIVVMIAWTVGLAGVAAVAYRRSGRKA